MKIRSIALILLSCCLILSTPSRAQEPKKSEPENILFVGNSLTYVNNLPAVFDAFAKQNQRNTHSYMLVEGGATLTERWQDQLVAKALSERRYDVVILQERGGDVMGSFGDQAEREAEQSGVKLRELIQAHGAKAIFLGTYQPKAASSKVLHQAELALTKKIGIAYVAITPLLEVGQMQFPQAPWLHADRGHPGSALSLLQAMALYRHMYGEEIAVQGFTVNAPIFDTSFGLPLQALSSQTPYSGKVLANEKQYSDKDVQMMRSIFKRQNDGKKSD
jgi:hypothetical protein